jgi:hypothetical protein
VLDLEMETQAASPVDETPWLTVACTAGKLL